MEYTYDINQFYWNKEHNTFYADAWDLVAILPDGSIHPEAFPNEKQQFFIRNYKTEGFRRFTFVDEIKDCVADVYEDGSFSQSEITSWIFESEDGIRCSICVEP
jgi:hypothetical protein